MSVRTALTARVATRAAAVVLIGFGLVAAAVGPCGALGLPEPGPSLASSLAPVTDVADQLTGAGSLPAPVPSVPVPSVPVPSVPVPAVPVPTVPQPAGDSPVVPRLGSMPGGLAPAPSSRPASDQPSTPRSEVSADDDPVAVDATVEGLLGLCARVPRSGTPVKADLVVLDRDVIAALAMAGLPIRELVEPCPAGAGGAHTSDPGTTTVASASAVRTAAARATGTIPGRLAFTGAEVIPTTLLAAGLLWLGVVLTLASRRLAVVQQLPRPTVSQPGVPG